MVPLSIETLNHSSILAVSDGVNGFLCFGFRFTTSSEEDSEEETAVFGLDFLRSCSRNA